METMGPEANSRPFRPKALRVHDYEGACWWCGAPANSAEHRYKRTDLVREFGPTAFASKQPISVKRQDGHERRGRGPNSKSFKFQKSICARCNGDRSQPFDRAYDQFIEFILDRDGRLLKRRKINLRDLWGDDWFDPFQNLLRYYAKHAACRLVEELDLFIEPELIGFLDGAEGPDFLVFDFTIWGEMAGTISAYESVFSERFGFLANGPLFSHPGQAAEEWIAIEGDATSGWIRLHWYYGSTTVGFGDPAQNGQIQLTDPHSKHGELRTRLTLGALMAASKKYQSLSGRDLQEDLDSLRRRLTLN